MKNILLFFIVLTPIFAQSQATINRWSYNKLERAEEALDSLINLVNTVYEDEKEFLSLFNESQNKWEEFTHSHMEALFPGDNKNLEWGSMYTDCYSKHKKKLVEQRLESVNFWIAEYDRKNDCTGSRGFKSRIIKIE